MDLQKIKVGYREAKSRKEATGAQLNYLIEWWESVRIEYEKEIHSYRSWGINFPEYKPLPNPNLVPSASIFYLEELIGIKREIINLNGALPHYEQLMSLVEWEINRVLSYRNENETLAKRLQT